MRLRFADTKVERLQGRVCLLTHSGHLLLELDGNQYQWAVKAGFVDPHNLHYSLFEYVRMIGDVTSGAVSQETIINKKPTPQSDREFLASCNITW